MLTTSQRFKVREACAKAIRAEVRRIGTGGIARVAGWLKEDEANVRRWSALIGYPAYTTCERIGPLLGVALEPKP